MVSHDMANIVHQGGKILQMRQKPLFWGYDERICEE